jgi:hypothetical protein
VISDKRRPLPPRDNTEFIPMVDRLLFQSVSRGMMWWPLRYDYCLLSDRLLVGAMHACLMPWSPEESIEPPLSGGGGLVR